jgi:pimeloyl-ACP methyl ester carboxylesterase
MTELPIRLSEQLRRFREAHPPRHLDAAGANWEYLSAGQGGRAVVLLPGGGGAGEDMFTLMAGLETDFRVLAIGCPLSMTRTQDVVDGLAAILDHEGVAQACLLGQSLGGAFAERFMLRYPERTNSLVLANIAHFGKLRAAFIRGLLPLIPRLPRWLARRRVRSTFSRLLKGHPEKEFWVSLLSAEIERIGQDGMFNRLLCLRDAMDGFPASGADLRGWNGPVLILESDNETGFTMRERLALRRLYPSAEVHVFQGAGHLSLYTQPQEFEAAVRRFLSR